jgi:hypothetical protein
VRRHKHASNRQPHVQDCKPEESFVPSGIFFAAGCAERGMKLGEPLPPIVLKVLLPSSAVLLKILLPAPPHFL